MSVYSIFTFDLPQFQTLNKMINISILCRDNSDKLINETYIETKKSEKHTIKSFYYYMPMCCFLLFSSFLIIGLTVILICATVYMVLKSHTYCPNFQSK